MILHKIGVISFIHKGEFSGQLRLGGCICFAANASLKHTRAGVRKFFDGENRMQPAQNLAPTINPIDMVESIFAARSFELERRNPDEVVVEVQGKWANMLLFFAWEASMKCLHMSCLMDIDNKLADRSKIFELLALVNENLWVGHFSYWTEQNMPVFKNSVFLNYGEEFFEHKISQMIDIAVKECERVYPVFKVVLTKGMDPKEALYPLMMETIGQA